MNNTVKKFDRKILKYAKKIMDSLDGCNIIVAKDRYDFYIDSDHEEYDEIVKQSIMSEDDDIAVMELSKSFLSKNKEKLDELDKINSLRKAPNQTRVFYDYDLLKKYLDKFEFSMEEQAEVLAYYFNITLKFILNVKINSSDYFKKLIEKKLNKELGVLSGFITKKIIDEELEKYYKKYKNELETVKHIRDIIDEDGNLLANEYAKEYDWIFDQIVLRIEDEFVNIILQGSKLKYDKELAKKEANRQAELARLKASEERKALLEIQAANRTMANRERREAIQELKKYLENDLPIRYIEEFEILIIIELMKKVGYSKEQINAVIKAINANNLKLADDYIAKLNAEKEIEYRNRLERYLTEDEQAIVSEGSSIANSIDAIKNEIYNLIVDDLKEIKTIILNLEQTDLEAEELLKLYISELKDNINNYHLSDYRNSEEYLKLFRAKENNE